MTDHDLGPLRFTIERRALVYAPATRKVARFDPPRLVADCPMPDCEWFTTAPDSTAGCVLAVIARQHHARTAHPEAIIAGGLVLDPPPYKVPELVEVRLGTGETIEVSVPPVFRRVDL